MYFASRLATLSTMPSTVIISTVTQDSFSLSDVTTAPENSSLPQTINPSNRSVVPDYEFPSFEFGVSLGGGILLGFIFGILLMCAVKKTVKLPKKRNVIQTPLNPIAYSNFDDCIREMHQPDQLYSTPRQTESRNPGPSGSSNLPRKALIVKRKNRMTQTSATRPYSLVKFTSREISTQTVAFWRESSPESERAYDPDTAAICEPNQSLKESERSLLYKIIQSSRVIRGVEKNTTEHGKIISINEDKPFPTFVESQKQLFSESTISTASYIKPDNMSTLRRMPSNTTPEDDDDRYVNTAKMKKPMRKNIHSKMGDDYIKLESKTKLHKTDDDHTYVNSLEFKKNKTDTRCDRSADISSFLTIKAGGKFSYLTDEGQNILHKCHHTDSQFILLNFTDDLMSLLKSQEDLAAPNEFDCHDDDYLPMCASFEDVNDPYMRMDRKRNK